MSDSTATAGTVIDAPIEHVREALLSATLLPEWNPAFVKVEGTHALSRAPSTGSRPSGAYGEH